MPLNLDALYSVFRLEVHMHDRFGRAAGMKAATGFVVRVDEGKIVMVTCRHVVDPTWQAPGAYNQERFGEQAAFIRCLGRPEGDDLREFVIAAPEIFVSDNMNEDIAVFKIGQIFVPGNDHQHLIFHRWFAPEMPLMLDTADAIEKSLLVGDQMAFVGYPDIGTSSYDRPLVRMGWLVSDPIRPVEFNQVTGNALIIEGFATKGMSGAPVLALQRGLNTSGGLHDSSFRAMCLVGVNAGYLGLPDHVHGQMSYAFKSTVIVECLKKAFP